MIVASAHLDNLLHPPVKIRCEGIVMASALVDRCCVNGNQVGVMEWLWLWRCEVIECISNFSRCGWLGWLGGGGQKMSIHGIHGRFA